MRLFIKEVEVIDSGSTFNGMKVNILVDKNKISAINPAKEPKADKVIELPGLKISPAWLDMRVFSGEPGEEYREDLQSLSNVLMHGGFASALLMPNTTPVMQQKADIRSVLATQKDQLVKLLPAAAISKNCEGEEMNEMLDLHHAGAVAFTDGAQPLWNSDLLVKTLQYLQKFDGVLINFPQDRMLAMYGQMNEGLASTGLGMKGIPNVAEEIMIQRDLELLRYAGGKIHFSCISTAKSVFLIKAAKKEGLKVSCDVNIHHLILEDSKLESFDTNYKLLPPLRNKRDREALIKGVNEGTIDVIVSGHQPYDEDHKKMEFDQADFGIMGAQILYPLYNKYLSKKMKLDVFIRAIEQNPKTILKVERSSIEEGAQANFTLFTDQTDWIFNAESNLSKSANSPFIGETFYAACVGVFAHANYFLADFINQKVS